MPTLPSFDVPDADVAVIALEDGKGRQFTLMPRRVSLCIILLVAFFGYSGQDVA
jgi:hypothetical protein